MRMPKILLTFLATLFLTAGAVQATPAGSGELLVELEATDLPAALPDLQAAITQPGETAALKVELQAGQTYSIEATPTDGNTVNTPEIIVHSAAGVYSGYGVGQTDFTAQRGGEYYILIRATRGATGDFTVSLQPIAGSTRGPLQFRDGLAAINGSINYKDQAKTYGIELTADRIYEVTVLGKGDFDPQLDIYGPDGKRNAHNDDKPEFSTAGYGDSTDPRLLFNPASDGVHVLEVRAYNGDYLSGDFAVLVEPVEIEVWRMIQGPRVFTLGPQHNGKLLLAVHLQRGREYTIDVFGCDSRGQVLDKCMPDPYLRVLDAKLNPVGEPADDNSETGTLDPVFTFTPERGGVHFLEITEVNDETGDVQLQISN